MTPQELYLIYRQVEEIIERLKETDKCCFDDAIKLGERFSDELFSMVGKLAAWEIDDEYFKNKKG